MAQTTEIDLKEFVNELAQYLEDIGVTVENEHLLEGIESYASLVDADGQDDNSTVLMIRVNW